MGKTNFLIERSWGEFIKNVPNEDAGKLFKALFESQNGIKPELGNSLMDGFLEMMVAKIAENDAEYEKKKNRNRENVNKRWNKDAVIDENTKNTTVKPVPTEIREEISNTTPEQYGTVQNGTEQYKRSGIDKLQEVSKRDKLLEDVRDIISFLNQESGSRFRHNRDSTINAINARLNDGYTVDEIKGVISHRVREWKDTDMEKYLTPDTLFRPSKFDKYYNEWCKAQPKTAIKECDVGVQTDNQCGKNDGFDSWDLPPDDYDRMMAETTGDNPLMTYDEWIENWKRETGYKDDQ